MKLLFYVFDKNKKIKGAPLCLTTDFNTHATYWQQATSHARANIQLIHAQRFQVREAFVGTLNTQLLYSKQSDMLKIHTSFQSWMKMIGCHTDNVHTSLHTHHCVCLCVFMCDHWWSYILKSPRQSS